MQRNAIVPYILIMAFGIGLIFFLSLEGVGNQEEIAEEQAAEEGGNASEGGATEGGEVEEGGEAGASDFDPEQLAQQQCVSCHGSSYEGGVGPSLVGTELPAEEIKDVLANGKGMMPGGLVPQENLDAMTEWILSLE